MRWLLAAALALAPVACNRPPDPADSRAAASISPASRPDPGVAALAPGLRPGMNAVQTEMALLHQATLTTVDAVVNNTLARVPPSFERVDGARRNTVTFLGTGSYRPPKNPQRMAEFAQLDDAFHPQLAKLVQAAAANDLPLATRQLGVVLDGCTGCHVRFRY